MPEPHFFLNPFAVAELIEELTDDEVLALRIYVGQSRGQEFLERASAWLIEKKIGAAHA